MNIKIYRILTVLFSTIFFYSCSAQLKVKKEYYPNGNLKIKYYVNEEGNKEGEEIIYYDSGINKEKKTWVDGRLKDSIYLYTSTGKVYQKGIVQDNGWLKLYESDKLVFEGKTSNGKLDGVGRYFKDGKLIMSKTFNDDKETGLNFVLHDSLNTPKYIYHSENGKRTGLLMDFYDNGILKSVREADIFHEGQYFKFNKNGTIKSIGYKVNGKLNGWLYKFDENGIFLKKLFYKKGNVTQGL